MESIVNEVNAERLYKHILQIEGEKHPINSPERMEACADYILNEFESYGLKTNVHEFDVDGFDYTFRNIEATVGGSGPELLIVSHYDTVRNAPGADDNGSAITVMLEVARILSMHQPEGAVRFVSFNLEELNPTLAKKTLALLLEHGIMDEDNRYTSWHTAETLKKYWNLFMEYQPSSANFSEASARVISELRDGLNSNELAYLNALHTLNEGVTKLNYQGMIGIMGSSAWVREAPSREITVKGVICLESMGYVSSKEHSQRLPEGLDPNMFKTFNTQSDLTVGDFLAIVADCNSDSLGNAVCAQCELDSVKLPYAYLQADFNYEQAVQIMPDILASDHAPFWREGIPALMLTDSANFRNPYYHTPADTIDKLDFNFLEKICKAVITTAFNF